MEIRDWAAERIIIYSKIFPSNALVTFRDLLIFAPPLPCSIMVVRQILALYVRVRILARQPEDKNPPIWRVFSLCHFRGENRRESK